MASPSRVDQRRYRGSSGEERRSQRREQFLLAALRVYGARGYRHATVKAVCEAAGLTERYFYESFANSEALLVASFQAVTAFLWGELERALAGATGDVRERARAVLTAYYQALRDNPPSARVFLVEISGVSAAVDEALIAALRELGVLLLRAVDPTGQGPAAREALLRTGVVGGVIHIALSWIMSGYARPVAEVVDAAVGLTLVLAPEPERFTRPGAGPSAGG